MKLCMRKLTALWLLQVRLSTPESRVAHILAGCEAAVERSPVSWAPNELLQGWGDSRGKAAKAEHWRAFLVEWSRELPLESGSVVFAICVRTLIGHILNCKLIFFHCYSKTCYSQHLVKSLLAGSIVSMLASSFSENCKSQYKRSNAMHDNMMGLS